MIALRTTAFALGLGLGCNPAADVTPKAGPTSSPETSTSQTRVAASVRAIDDLQSAFKQAVETAGPSVVSVYSTKTARSPGPGFGPRGGPFDFFGPGMPPQQFEQRGAGSGFIVDAEGHILTNNHVVEGADEVKVQLADDREFDAKVVGTDPATDVAVLKIEAEGLDPIELGDSGVLEVGDWVLAIGNPFGLPRTVSAGIVSATGRANVGIVDYENFIQTDAAVNPGNSGGPLVDLAGRVVGINTAIASRSGGNNGIAFAIPIDMVKPVMDQLVTTGTVTRGQLGVVISELSQEMAESFGYAGSKGILVQDVASGSPAEKAGIRSGDIITSLDGEPVAALQPFRAAIAKRSPGTKVELGIFRDRKPQTLAVELGAQEGAKQAKAGADQGPKLGIALQNVTPELQRRLDLDEARGAVVVEVLPGSPAAKAGLRPGDVLDQVGDAEVASAEQALRLLEDADLAKGIRIRVRRDGMGHFVIVKAK